jgi:hypothetical protein
MSAPTVRNGVLVLTQQELGALNSMLQEGLVVCSVGRKPERPFAPPASTKFRSGGTKWLLAAGAVAVAMLLLISTLSYRGFCFRHERFLSDQEYFDAAINQIIQRDNEQLVSSNQSGTAFNSVHVLKYASTDEFQRQNPQCCKIVSHNVGDSGPYTSFSQRLFGYAARIVSITYLVRYTDETGGQKSALKTEQFAVTNCGRAWR